MSLLFRSAIASLLFSTALLTAPFAHAALELQPGEWQEVETGEEDGKPVKPETTTTCMTPEEAKDPEKQFTAMDKEMKGQCKTFDVKRDGNTLSLRMQCGDPKQIAMDISATFTVQSPQSYTSVVKSSVTMAGKTTTSNKTSQAKRIGDCKK